MGFQYSYATLYLPIPNGDLVWRDGFQIVIGYKNVPLLIGACYRG